VDHLDSTTNPRPDSAHPAAAFCPPHNPFFDCLGTTYANDRFPIDVACLPDLAQGLRRFYLLIIITAANQVHKFLDALYVWIKHRWLRF
jgi:hypothetical protein